MAQSLGRKLKRSNAIAYKDSRGDVQFVHKTHKWRISTLTTEMIKNRIKNEDLIYCHNKPIVKSI